MTDQFEDAPTEHSMFVGRDHPERVGPYRILQIIGEGGMGIVYEAEQIEPVSRRVALKMLRAGLESKEVVARFEAERQALSVMNHPNIARVFDAGADELGRPYFVMEFVQGIPISVYCDKRRLKIRERLELFIPVCAAVQHAHQKGVIHRDLKPSNVLVSDMGKQPFPKIIDFGIAKAVAQRLTQRTLVTAFGQVLGTPAYMSPEQAEKSGLDIDTRTDVYSLGVMLYELLVGCLPIDPADSGLHEFIASLANAQTDPPPLRLRLTQLGEKSSAVVLARSTDLRSLRKELHGDLEWIVMKAMDRDRNRRYETAAALAADLRNYLKSEPVSARAPTPAYRLRKFVHRHRVGTVFGAILALLVIAFASLMAYQAEIVSRERDRARQEAAKAQAVSDFMSATLLAPDPLNGMGRDVTVVEALKTATEKLDQAFPGQPEVEAKVRSAIGWAYFQLGSYDQAEPLLRKALELREQTLSSEHPDLASSLLQWGSLLRVRADYESAESHFRRALAIQRSTGRSSGPAVIETLEALGVMLGELGRYDEADSVLGEALELAEQQYTSDSLEYVEVQNQIAVLKWNEGDYEAVEPLWLRLLKTRRRLLGQEHPLVAEALNNLAVLYDNTGRPEKAEENYRAALAIMQKTLGPEHEEVSAAMSNLAILLDSKDKVEEAEQLYREALRIDRKQLGAGNPAVASDLVNLASMLCERGRAKEGVPLLDEAMSTFSAALEVDNWRIGNTFQWRGLCLIKLGKYQAAEKDLLEGIRILKLALGEDNWRVTKAQERLNELHELSGGNSSQ